MQIDLTKVFARDNQELNMECQLEARSLTYMGESFPIKEKEPFVLRLAHSAKRKLTISGSTKVTCLLPCDRCLKDVSVKFEPDFYREIDFDTLSEEPEEALEVSSFVQENILDVDAFVSNEILMEWPSKVLCSESCKGICKKCGKNLNEGECGCEQTEPDPRMAAIRDIFYENYKEEV